MKEMCLSHSLPALVPVAQACVNHGTSNSETQYCTADI